MRYGSVCSGIEAATAAWHPLGWTPAFFSEIEPFPRAVLAHHYPKVPLHGDFTTIGADEYGAIDLLVGGTPCQSFSIAGLRGGLDDDRGNLALEFLRLADRKHPRWLVWENVPGVLSSNGGRDFGSILGGMGELGYGTAYRILDAQHFGVPQRRRRVFVVGYLGDWRRAAAVLFERHSLSGHPAPRREARSLVAALTANGVGTCGADDNQGQAGHSIPQAFGGNNTRGAIDVSTALSSHGGPHGGPHGRLDFESETFIAHSLRGEGFDASEDGTGRGTPLVPVAFAENTRHEIRLEGGDGLRTGALSTGGGKPGQGVPTVAFAIQERAVSENLNQGPQGKGYQADVAYTLEARNKVQSVASRAVRRLTPRECERLMGFPDDFTLVPNRNKPAADGPRYKALGNSMAVPVMAWIGERIQQVENMVYRP